MFLFDCILTHNGNWQPPAQCPHQPMEENKEREKEPGNANICGLSESVEMELELEGSAPEGVAPGEVELLAAMSEGMAAPTLLGLRVQRVLALVILLPHFCNTKSRVKHHNFFKILYCHFHIMFTI